MITLVTEPKLEQKLSVLCLDCLQSFFQLGAPCDLQPDIIYCNANPSLPHPCLSSDKHPLYDLPTFWRSNPGGWRRYTCVDLPNSIIAGQLKHLHKVWNRLSQDKWIHQTTQGFRISLLVTPVQRLYQPPVMNKEMSLNLNGELHYLLFREIIVRSGITSLTSLDVCVSSLHYSKEEQRALVDSEPKSIESVYPKATF